MKTTTKIATLIKMIATRPPKTPPTIVAVLLSSSNCVIATVHTHRDNNTTSCYLNTFCAVYSYTMHIINVNVCAMNILQVSVWPLYE